MLLEKFSYVSLQKYFDKGSNYGKDSKQTHRSDRQYSTAEIVGLYGKI